MYVCVKRFGKGMVDALVGLFNVAWRAWLGYHVYLTKRGVFGKTPLMTYGLRVCAEMITSRF